MGGCNCTRHCQIHWEQVRVRCLATNQDWRMEHDFNHEPFGFGQPTLPPEPQLFVVSDWTPQKLDMFLLYSFNLLHLSESVLYYLSQEKASDVIKGTSKPTSHQCCIHSPTLLLFLSKHIKGLAGNSYSILGLKKKVAFCVCFSHNMVLKEDEQWHLKCQKD